MIRIPQFLPAQQTARDLNLQFKHLKQPENELSEDELSDDFKDQIENMFPDYTITKTDIDKQLTVTLKPTDDAPSLDYVGIMKSRCNVRSIDGWMKILNPLHEFPDMAYISHVDVKVPTISIGNLVDENTYWQHLKIKLPDQTEARLEFEHDMQRVTCYIMTTKEWYKLSFDYRSVEGYVIADIFNDSLSMYLPMKCPPKIWKATKDNIQDQRSIFQEKKKDRGIFEYTEEEVIENGLKYVRWTRENKIGEYKTSQLGNCSVFQFTINKTVGEKMEMYQRQTIAGFIRHRYTVFSASIKHETVNSRYKESVIDRILDESEHCKKYQEVRFAALYGLLMLVAKGTRITDKLSLSSPLFHTLCEILGKLKTVEYVKPLVKAISLLGLRLDKDRFLDIPSTISELYKDECEKFEKKEEQLINKNWFMVRRVTITPTRNIFDPPELNTSNRVLRHEEHNPDYFIRVSFRDEDFTALHLEKESKDYENSVIDRIKDLFYNGIKIGSSRGRTYRFLGCSNSQLRSSGAWFVADHDGKTVQIIRDFIGDFSGERSLSKYVSRLGLAFTTTEAYQILANEEAISDVETPDKEYCFSDGIGKISTSIAEQIKESKELDYLPSAYQIRYGGCKGMVARDPTLGEEGRIIQLRPSQKKFVSKHKEIEFCQASKPSLLYMNRQVIWLLRGYRVPAEKFVNLQNNTLIGLADSLRECSVASDFLKNYQGNMIFKKVMDGGIDLTQEPFYRKQLLSLYRFHVKEVLTRTRIVMPADKGRQMLGVMDETFTLEYGQVFVQYSRNIDNPTRETVILTGKIFITKNPCVHPGDLRMFRAVDVPALHHMHDVVVFPAKGRRPHPNELSGSDLDGDEYFVCWDKELIPLTNQNHDAGEYGSSAAKLEEKPITPQQLTDHVITHITKPNNLGRISNAHMAHCDRDPDGVLCEKAVELAKQHSIAVDFPKTGIPENFSKDLKVYEFPDWMEKPDKPCYRSTSVVGDCYRICRSLYHVLGEHDTGTKLDANYLDLRLVIPGHRDYLKKAIETCNDYNQELGQLMSQYGIEDEGDIACGCLNKVKTSIDNDKKKNYDITEECLKFYRNLQKQYETKFFSSFNTKKDEWMGDATKDECLKKASAWYLAAYKYATPIPGITHKLLSFPWCVSDVLIELVKSSPRTNENCTETLFKNMRAWFLKEPSEDNTETLEKLSYVVTKHSLDTIDNDFLGLKNSKESIILATKNPIKSLQYIQKDLCSACEGWDKGFIESIGNRDVFLAIHNYPNIVILNDVKCYEKICIIQEYVRKYPYLAVVFSVIERWCVSNKLNITLNVLSYDFLLLCILYLEMEETVKPPLRLLQLDLKRINLSMLTKVKKIDQEVVEENCARLYLGYLKSIIYGKVFSFKEKDMDGKLPKYILETTQKLRNNLNSNSVKYISYTMREYHETCYFLYNEDQTSNETKVSRRRGDKKMGKYLKRRCFLIYHVASLGQEYLIQQTKLDINIRSVVTSHDNMLVIEAWDRTPEVLQEITESLQLVAPFYITDRNPPEVYIRNETIKGSVYVYFVNADRKIKNPNIHLYSYKYGTGACPKRPIGQMTDFHRPENLLDSAEMLVKQLSKEIQKHYNPYSHGLLRATWQFGTLCPLMDCQTNQGHYRTMWKRITNLDEQFSQHLLKNPHKFTCTDKDVIKFRWTIQFDYHPLTLHFRYNKATRQGMLEFVTWGEMTWGKIHLHLSTKSFFDSVINITSAASISKEHFFKAMPTFSSVYMSYFEITAHKNQPVFILSEKGLELIGDTYSKLETELVTTYRSAEIQEDVFIEVRNVTVHEYNTKFFKRETEVVAVLPKFDSQSTHLLERFYEICKSLSRQTS